MDLYDVEVLTFQIFRDWLLARRLSARYRATCSTMPMSEALEARVHLVRLYMFAHVYDVPQLRRDALEAYMSRCFSPDESIMRPAPTEVRLAYNGLPLDSSMVF